MFPCLVYVSLFTAVNICWLLFPPVPPAGVAHVLSPLQYVDADAVPPIAICVSSSASVFSSEDVMNVPLFVAVNICWLVFASSHLK